MLQYTYTIERGGQRVEKYTHEGNGTMTALKGLCVKFNLQADEFNIRRDSAELTNNEGSLGQLFGFRHSFSQLQR